MYEQQRFSTSESRTVLRGRPENKTGSISHVCFGESPSLSLSCIEGWQDNFTLLRFVGVLSVTFSLTLYFEELLLFCLY